MPQVRIILDDKRDAEKMIGYVKLPDERPLQIMLLKDLRVCMIEQFNTEQLTSLGAKDFQFLNQQVPVSRIQEEFLKIEDISLKLSSLDNHYQVPIRHPREIVNDLEADRDSEEEEEDELDEELGLVRAYSCPEPKFEKQPHHYMYMDNHSMNPLAALPTMTDVGNLADDILPESPIALKANTERKTTRQVTFKDDLIEQMPISDEENLRDTKRQEDSLGNVSLFQEQLEDEKEDGAPIVLVRSGGTVKQMKELLQAEWNEERGTVVPTPAERQDIERAVTEHGQYVEKEKNEEDKESSSESGNVGEESSSEMTRVLVAKSASPPMLATSPLDKGNMSLQPSLFMTDKNKEIDQTPIILEKKAQAPQDKSNIITKSFSLQPNTQLQLSVPQDIFNLPLNVSHDRSYSLLSYSGFRSNLVPQIDHRNEFLIIGPTPDRTVFENNGKMPEGQEVDQFLAALKNIKHSRKKPLWVDLTCSPSTFEKIAANIGMKIHPLTIEDCVSHDCREKLELFDHYLFICIRAPVQARREETQRIAIIVFKSIIITFHEKPIEGMEQARKLIKRRHVRQKDQWYCPSPGWVCHTIIDGVVDALIPEVNRAVDEVQNLEQLVFMIEVDSQHELLHRFEAARNQLEMYRTRLWPKSALTHNLTNLEGRTFLKDVPAAYWRDINDHLSRMVDTAQIALQTLDSLQNVFVAKVSLDMSNYADTLNEIVGRLGVISILYLPLVFITGLFGTNMWIPFQIGLTDIVPEEYIQIGFPFVLSLMIVTLSITYGLIKTSGWMAPFTEKEL